MPRCTRVVLLAIVACSLSSTSPARAVTHVRVPLACTHGPNGQVYTTDVSVPETVKKGETFTIRLDGVTSGTISETGLRYVHDMAADFLVPTGTSFVEGSLRIVPNTGTPNVRANAKVWHEKGVVHMLLPAHVENGSSYTPPDIEFKATASADPGTIAALKFAQYRVSANAIVIGDVNVTCDPSPKPYRVGTTSITTP
jgi:hypothetical protein